jgi:uncharacterized membrane protein YfhO
MLSLIKAVEVAKGFLSDLPQYSLYSFIPVLQMLLLLNVMVAYSLMLFGCLLQRLPTEMRVNSAKNCFWGQMAI